MEIRYIREPIPVPPAAGRAGGPARSLGGRSAGPSAGPRRGPELRQGRAGEARQGAHACS